MIQEISEYFNRFYQTILKEHINDAIIHSEWTYFLSMFKNAALEKERIELYLTILTGERTKRLEQKEKGYTLGSLSKTDSVNTKAESKNKFNENQQNQFDISEIKLEKRFSENWKLNASNQSSKTAKDVKLTPESISLKKKVSIEEDINRHCIRSIEDEPWTSKGKNDSFHALTSVFSPHSYAYTRPKSTTELALQMRETKIKQKHNKLREISQRLVNVFEGTKLRA